eukprot:COSAG06_NODE_71107_length_187_cov_135.772727_1_plen_62_part_11
MMGFCLAVEKIVKSRWCGNVLLKKSFLCIKKGGGKRDRLYIRIRGSECFDNVSVLLELCEKR